MSLTLLRQEHCYVRVPPRSREACTTMPLEQEEGPMVSKSGKPLVSKGAELILFFRLLVPAASLLPLIGALLLLEPGVVNQLFGAYSSLPVSSD